MAQEIRHSAGKGQVGAYPQLHHRQSGARGDACTHQEMAVVPQVLPQLHRSESRPGDEAVVSIRFDGQTQYRPCGRHRGRPRTPWPFGSGMRPRLAPLRHTRREAACCHQPRNRICGNPGNPRRLRRNHYDRHNDAGHSRERTGPDADQCQGRLGQRYPDGSRHRRHKGYVESRARQSFAHSEVYRGS